MPTTRTKVPRLRPILRYHGGKWMLAPWIISQFPAHRTYVEPYGGGASVLLRKPRAHTEVYNDLDFAVVNVFRMARDRGGELKALLQLTPYARSEFEDAYLPSEDPLELARRTIVRSFMGLGSAAVNGIRTGFVTNNGATAGTSPAPTWVNYAEAFDLLIERLRPVVIECRAALDLIRQHDSPRTLFYIDPPYVPATRSAGRAYNYELTDADHRELAQTLAGCVGAVVLSGYRCDLYDELYSGWTRLERPDGIDHPRSDREVLWLNFKQGASA